MARHAQTTQNNKFAISLQYLKKVMSDEVDFMHADQHESFLQIDTIVFDGDGQAFPEFLKQQVCNVFTISQKRYFIRVEVDFFHADKHQSFLQVDFNFLGITVSLR